MFTIGRAATGFVKDYLAAPNARSGSPAPVSSPPPKATLPNSRIPVNDTDFPDSPVSETSDHSFVEADPRGLHASGARNGTNLGDDGSDISEHLRAPTSRPSTSAGLTESVTDDLDDLDSDDFPGARGSRPAPNAETRAKLETHSHYPPLLTTGLQHHRPQSFQSVERWRAFVKNDDISEWSVVRSSKKEIAELYRLQEEYEAKLQEKDATIEKERTTWEWVQKDLVERQKQEMDAMKQRLEAELSNLRNDLRKTQSLLDAGNDELQMARDILRQNGADDTVQSAAIDAGIQRLKSGYEIRLLAKDRAIDELKRTHQRERQESAEAQRAAEMKLKLKEETWQEEKQVLLTERDQQRKAFGYATQSNTNLIDKLREDMSKTEALLDTRNKELEKSQSQLKKIQQKWKELQDKNRREISEDADQWRQSSANSRGRASSSASSENPRPGQNLTRIPHTFSFSPILSGNVTYEDVKRLLESLNSEIFQFAAQFTDDIDELRSTRPNTELIEGERVDALKEMSNILGSNIVQYLNSEVEREDFDAVSQCALQAILLHWCKRIINMWAWSKEVSNALKEIYEGMHTTGNPDAARRWKAATRAQSRTKWEGEWNMVMERVSNSVLKFLVLITRGRPISADNKERKRQLAHQKISSILEIAFQINKATGEHITSADYEVFCPRPGDKFDIRNMVDDNEQPVIGKFQTDEPTRQEIVCTCHLGLRRVVRETSSSHAKQQVAVVSKARVLLASALTDWEDNLKRV
ncbi:hypothetical protein VKT23_000216 [Stygiomarasmius scandens]|uniref:Uncharacterized protein n=1 Tax=Marasmiellus scandens TaxID=2682957 RepID=A0ABR1K7D6_9AGAR